MAVLANSIIPTYSITTVILESVTLPAGFSGNIAVSQTNLIFTDLGMPLAIVEKKSGPESNRQIWS